MAHDLDVWLFADHIGTLSVVGGRLSFTYATEWLARADAVTLSCALPLQPESFDDFSSRPFFAGLLPEGGMRRLIAQQFQVSRQNDFALLDAIGGECAGAVTFLAQGQPLPVPCEGDDIEWLSEESLVALLDELPRRPMLAGKNGLRLSLAGAQDKLPVVFEAGRIGLPCNGTPSTHILKPAIQAVEDSVINEGFCLALAAAMKLKTAQAHIQQIHGRDFLLVERYDRFVDAQGRLQRRHQEDFCQALGLVPEMKYQNEGGPDLAQCFDLIRRVTRPSAPHVLRLLDCVIFNALIGNHDAHAKNFSLLYTEQGLVLAPCYDILATTVYPNLTPKMAMKIGSRYKFSEVQVQHWDDFAASAGLSKAQMHKRILAFAEQMPVVARQLEATSGGQFAGHPMVNKIIGVIEQRSSLTLRRFAEFGA